MAAAYKLVISSVNCYNSVLIDRRRQHAVHYCTGNCKAFMHGVQCMVVHHSICAQLVQAVDSLAPGVRSGESNQSSTVIENSLNASGIEDSHQVLHPSAARIKKVSSVQGIGNLKDITGEAINLASGKTKEFSFEKIKSSSSHHVTFRKGRKVRPESFSRKSADFDLLYSHFSHDENCPPFNVLHGVAGEEKGQLSRSTSLEQNLNSMASLYLQNFSEEYLITQILEKHKLDSSGSGEDIKMCLDILLKCSEDLKKCTDIIKQCIKKKSGGGGSGVSSNDQFVNPERIYMNVMARLSSYLKKLPFELEYGQTGCSEPSDLAELVNSLHGLQPSPFSPMFGRDQPPKYEDVVQSPPQLGHLHPSTTEMQTMLTPDVGGQPSITKHTEVAPPSLPPKLKHSNNLQFQQKNSRSSNTTLPHLLTAHSSENASSHSPSRSNVITSKDSSECLFIEEDSDREKVLGKERRAERKSVEHWTSGKKDPSRTDTTSILSEDRGKNLRTNTLSNAAANSLGRGTAEDLLSTKPYKGTTNNPASSKDHEEIDKLLLDLEHFSKKIEHTLRDAPLAGSSLSTSKGISLASGQLPGSTLEPTTKALMPLDKGSLTTSSRGKETNGHKMDEEDRTLLLRILESIEDFAQELVECRAGTGTLSKEREVMQILQENLSPTSSSYPATLPQSSHKGPEAKDTGPTLLIQQTPAVIKVQSRQEKKPGTPPPAPVIPVPSPRPASPPPSVNHVIVSAPIAINIPRFYFPKGLPNPCSTVDESLARAEAAFSEMEDEKADIYEMGKITKACGCPLYWKAPIFNAAGGERTGFVSVHSFIAMWRKLLQSCHDDASRFIHLLAKLGCNYLEQEDFIPLLQDVVDTHPGLTFLKDAPEFHSRYITTVIQRIFYTVNRSWSGRITLTELRRSNFLQTLALLEEEDDINQITDYFSYEHFYVIYCKFWELDTDHDLYIDKKDLARYNDHASSNRIIDRIFSGAVTRGNTVQREGKMSYADFVWFLISEEDKKNPTSIEYWYRCMDLDGDGALSMYEMEYFYEEQCERMEAMGIEPLPFHDLLCQTLDLVKPECEGKITLRDLKKCRMAHIFYDTCFNLEKYLDHEQRDPFAVQKDVENDGPEPSDWDRYAAEEYEILVAEESANDQLQEGSFEEDYEADDLISNSENGSKMDAIVISDLSA